MLARFGITGDDVHKPVTQMSGGQHNRVALAKLAADNPNFIILDEPTNHLDVWSRTALERALKKFDGTVLIVSHNRFLIDQVCDHLIAFHGGQAKIIDGNYRTYRHMILDRSNGVDSAGGPRRARDSDRRANRPAAAKRKRRFPYRKVEDLEQEIQQNESVIARLHGELADPEVLRSREKVISAREQIERHAESLAELYEHWEEAVELN